MINTKIGRWFIISDFFYKKTGKNKYRYVTCKCDCGTIKDVRTSSLINNNSKSCGCLQKEQTSKSHHKHGLKQHKLYAIWHSMLDRCYNAKHKDYDWYGKRNIKVCEQWHDVTRFYNDNIGLWKPGLQIDRINNNGNYEPENCRWVTNKTNANNRRSNILLTIWNETKTMQEWLEDQRCVVSRYVLTVRIKNNWNLEKALTTKYGHNITKTI